MHIAVCINISVVLDQCVSLHTHCSCGNYNSQAIPVFDCSILAVHVYFSVIVSLFTPAASPFGW